MQKVMFVIGVFGVAFILAGITFDAVTGASDAHVTRKSDDPPDTIRLAKFFWQIAFATTAAFVMYLKLEERPS